MKLRRFFKHTKAYFFSVILIFSIVLGVLTGHVLGSDAVQLKPLGDIFLNLLFTFVVPLVFFSVSSAIAEMGNLKKMWKITINMLAVFLFTGMIAAIFMLLVVKLFPLGNNIFFQIDSSHNQSYPANIAKQLTNIFTVPDFIHIFSHNNMLPLIIFSILIGIATSSMGKSGKWFSRFLQLGATVFMKCFSIIMYYAPIGFFAYSAVIIGEMGPKFLETYYYTTIVYYIAGILYFVCAFTFYAYLSSGLTGIKAFWKNVSLPAMTALATCSSAASIPANLEATKAIGVPIEIDELVIPLGTIIHKDGSILGGIVKIAFLFGIFHMSFSTLPILVTAIIVGMLVGTVMGAIPSGGMTGELLILSVYGFPPQTLILIATISILIDPLATMLNVTGNTVCAMLVAKLTVGRKWLCKGT